MLNQGQRELLEKNKVTIIDPYSTFISPEVEIGNIKECTIYPGCRISGDETLISQGCEIGREGPVTIENCQLGRNVRLKAGYFCESTFLDGVEMGYGSHVRPGCLLEEGVKVGHCVGLKQTILFPFVALGSLINFCDCLMAGGTDDKNHSEVGSSYIHFNFTPHEDKATPSLIGDVPRGVMIREEPIFLGGQGGIVGPIKVAYGVVVAAGTILRKDMLKEGVILLGQGVVEKALPFHKGLYTNIKRVFWVNIEFIANLIALFHWYDQIRGFFALTKEEAVLFGYGKRRVQENIKERLKRLGEVVLRLEKSASLEEKIKGQDVRERYQPYLNNWEAVLSISNDYESIKGNDGYLKEFLMGIHRKANYIESIKSLPEEKVAIGTQWLQGIVDEYIAKIKALF